MIRHKAVLPDVPVNCTWHVSCKTMEARGNSMEGADRQRGNHGE